MRRVLRCGIALGILLVLVLAGVPSAGFGGDGCCCGPSAKFCPMKQRGMGAVCAIARADACSITAPGSEAPAPDQRPYSLRAMLVDERAAGLPNAKRQLFPPYVVLGAIFVAAPVTPPPKDR